MTFTKLFSSITESTIWCEDANTRIVWITMLAMADKYGRVFGSVPGLANRARVPLDETRKALEKFMAPDPDSRTKDFEGRRIEIIDGGWRLLNYVKYRSIRDEEDKREKTAERVRRHRERKKEGEVTLFETIVTRSNPNAEAEAEAEAVKQHIPPLAVKIDGGLVWSAWVDANRAAGRKDPAREGGNTKAAVTISELISDQAELQKILSAYLAHNDKFLLDNGHALRFLPSRIDAYRNGTTINGTHRPATSTNPAAFRTKLGEGGALDTIARLRRETAERATNRPPAETIPGNGSAVASRAVEVPC